MDIPNIINLFYPEENGLRSLLLAHSMQVKNKALAILDSQECPVLKINRKLVEHGALLHDIGIGLCHAPTILCMGKEHYIRHGILGAARLRRLASEASFSEDDRAELELCAKICERHTGAGLSKEDIIVQNLPLPHADFLPVSPEEKLICLADKFFSKSGDKQEKNLENILKSMQKFGQDTVKRFQELCDFFGVH